MDAAKTLINIEMNEEVSTAQQLDLKDQLLEMGSDKNEGLENDGSAGERGGGGRKWC